MGPGLNVDRTPALPARRLFALLLAATLFMGACGKNKVLERIQESGTMTVITRNNVHCYYIYRDQNMGFEYDLAMARRDLIKQQLIQLLIK